MFSGPFFTSNPSQIGHHFLATINGEAVGTTSYGSSARGENQEVDLLVNQHACFNHRNRKMIRNWWFCIVFPQYYTYISWRITGTVPLHQLRQFAGLRWCRRMVCLAEQLGKRCSNLQVYVASLFSQKPKTLFRFLFGMWGEFCWIYDIYIFMIHTVIYLSFPNGLNSGWWNIAKSTQIYLWSIKGWLSSQHLGYCSPMD